MAIDNTNYSDLGSELPSEENIQPWSGETNIFIKPGYNFEITDALLTNFHLPK